MTKILEFVGSMIGSLWPPAHDSDSESHTSPTTKWRRAVFSVLAVILCVMTFHILAIKGLLGFIGVTGVAHASDISNVSKQIAAIDERSKGVLYAIYAPQIRQAVRERCDTDSGAEREKINKKIDRIKNEYKLAAGKAFSPMPSCSEV